MEIAAIFATPAGRLAIVLGIATAVQVAMHAGGDAEENEVKESNSVTHAAKRRLSASKSDVSMG